MKYLLNGQVSDRLSFRLLEPKDFDTWTPLFLAENAAFFLGLDTTKTPLELTTLWFEKVFHRYENDLGGMNVLIDTSTGALVGQCGLLIQTIEEIERLEIGYSILPQYWNQGYASEAAQKCRDYCFEQNFWEAIISIVHPDNIGSARVAQKNGMSIEKRLASYKGMPVDIFRIDKAEWVEKYSPKS